MHEVVKAQAVALIGLLHVPGRHCAPIRLVPGGHAPAVQVAVLFVPLGQWLPQAPLLFTSEARIVSHPLAELLSQFAKPAAYVSPHAPAVHVAVLFGPLGHFVPHLPQFATSVCTFTQAEVLLPQQFGLFEGQQAWPHSSGWPAGAAGPQVKQAPWLCAASLLHWPRSG